VDELPANKSPLLLRYARAAVHAVPPTRYDAVRKLSLLETDGSPAVVSHVHLKTAPPGPGED
jgi:hypothetical protein